MIKFKDVANLYLGCQCLQTNGVKFVLSPQHFPSNWQAAGIGLKYSKPILRPITSMTDDEKKELYQIVFKRPFGKNGNIQYYQKERPLQSRWVLWSGVERLGIEENGHIWADSDLQRWEHNQHEVTRYLLSKGFDLFELIKSDEAINGSVTLKLEQPDA